MSLAIAAATPAEAVSTSNSINTVQVTLTPDAGSVLAIAWSWNTGPGDTPGSPSITDSLGAHLTYALQDHACRTNGSGVDGQAAIWTAVVGSSAAMTITVTSGTGTTAQGGSLKVWDITGQNAVPVGAHGKSSSTSAGSVTQAYTAQATGGQGFLVVCDWDLKGAETAGAGCTVDGSGNAGPEITYGFARRTTADDSSGGSNSLNVTLPGTSTNLSWVYLEVVPVAVAGAAPDASPSRLPSQLLQQLLSRRRAVLASPSATTFAQAVTGSVTPSGGLVQQPAKALAGSSTGSGALVRRTSKGLAGTATPSGILTALRLALVAVAGSITAAGSLARSTAKVLAGSATATGALARQTNKQAAGSSTAAGALTVIKAVLRTLAGSVSATGSLVRRDGKALTGSSTTAGVATRQTAKSTAGASTAAGALRRTPGKALGGSATVTGAIVRRTAKALAGLVMPAGAALKLLSHLLGGSISPAGDVDHADPNAAPPVPGVLTPSHSAPSLHATSSTSTHASSGTSSLNSTTGP